MKKVQLLIAGLCLLGGFYSCSDELDLQPLDRLTADAFYKNRTDFDGAIFASYSSIQDFWGTSTETLSENGEYWKLSMVITDDVASDATAISTFFESEQISIDIDNLQLRAADRPFAALYTQIYEGIFRANLVLANLDGENDLTPEDKAVLSAEAKFLRGWFHFQALKMFGTPPAALDIKTGINEQALANASQDELFTAILADMADAAAGLPESWDSGNTGRATAWAARAYIGKVNVWKEDWPAAITALADVVDNGPYMLMPNFEDNFNFSTENNAESIFEVQYGGPFSDDNLWVFDDTHSEDFKASQGIGRGWYWDASSSAGAPAGKLGWWVPTQSLVDAFEPGDLRASATFYQTGDMYYSYDGGGQAEVPYDPSWSASGYTLKKYRGQTNTVAGNHAPNGQADFNNERWMRFAEIKLLYAEALIRGGGDTGTAIQQIQDIRDRAGLTDPMDPDPLTAMMQEKRVEFATEPHRWFDIVRWGIGADVFGAAWEDRFNVFPFPQSEIDRSGGMLTQNPGY